MEKNYTPNPIDTKVLFAKLPKAAQNKVNEMIDAIAKNCHEKWAKNRADQGWSYGEKRDDEHKLHPCMKPYEELPEEEKLYDKDSAFDGAVITINALWEEGILSFEEE